MGGRAACDLGRSGGGPSGSETARVSELDGGEKSGSVIKCARAATQAGGRPARGFAARSPAANARKTAAEDARRIRTIFAQHDGEYRGEPGAGR